MPQVGSAWIQVTPSLRGWNQSVRQQLKKELAGVKGEVPIEGDFDGIKRESTKQGAEAGGEFARSFKKRVEAALKSLPDVKIDADSTPAQREIAQVRRELQTLSEKTVGIDIDAGEATAKINRLKARLDQLATENPTVDVEVDIGAASAQLGAIERQVERLDGRRANVQVDVDRDGNAQRASFFLNQQVNGLVLAGAGIAPVFVPAFAVAAAGALGFASALAGAGAGVGALVAVSVPALSAVSDAVKATDQAEKAAATTAVNTTRQRVQAAFQAQQAAERVGDAQQSADRTAVEGARRVQDAQRTLGDTRRDVARRIEDANDKLEDSERALSRAHDNVRQAQEDLNDARRDAIRLLQDLREQSSDLALSEEGAEIALLRARQRQAEVNRDAAATALDRREAALEVREAEDRLSDVQRDRRRTQQELNDAERAGVNGSELVIDANGRLADANQSLADARRNNIGAQQDLVRAEADGARAIADAERALSDARVSAAQANADASNAVADALQAQRQQAELARLEAENGIAANRNLAFALGELTPMQRTLYDGWIRLRDAFTQWSRSLEPAVIPLFIGGMRLIEQLLPLLTPLVLATADAFGYLLDRASAALDSPFWQRFIDFLTAASGPAIITLGESLGNIARGFAGILIAFGVFQGDMSRGLVDLTERFADWGEGLADNPGFHRFVDFVRTVWPTLKDTIKAVGRAFGAVVEALAPIGGGPVLLVLRGLADWVADMDPTTIQAIAFALGGIALAMKLIGIAAAITAIGPWGLAILGIAAAVAFAYFKFEGFREVVQGFIDWVREEVVPRLQAFGEAIVRLFEEEIRPRLEDFWAWFQEDIVPVIKDIGDVLLEVFRRIGEWFDRNWPRIQDFIEGYVNYLKWAWDTIVFPYLNLWWNILSNVIGPVLLWLWHYVVEPAFKAIAAVIEFAWNYVIKPVLMALAWFIEFVLGPVIDWLWNDVIKPAWSGISAAISFAWNYIIKPVFDAIVWVITNVLGPAFLWIWRFVIKPVFEAIWKIIQFAWNYVIKPIWDAINWFIRNVLVPVFLWLKDRVLAAWDRIKGGIRAAWGFIRDNILSPAKKFIEGVVDKFIWMKDRIGDVWKAVRKAAGSAWDKITDVIRGAVNIAIKIVNKVIGAINRIASGLGIDVEIRTITPLKDPDKHAMGTYDLAKDGSFITGGARAIVGEGRQQYPEAVIATDPQFRPRNVGILGWTADQLGYDLVPRMASGGIARAKGPGIAGLYPPLAGAVAKVIREGGGRVSISSGWRDSAQQAALYHRYQSGQGPVAARPGSSQHEGGNAVDFGGNVSLYTRLAQKAGLIRTVPSEKWHWEFPGQGRGGGGGGGGGIFSSVADAVGAIVDAARGIGDIDLKLIRGAAGWVKDQAIKWAKRVAFEVLEPVVGSAGGIGRAYLEAGGGGSVERWRGDALRALRSTGSPTSWIGSLLRRMQQESGGNPNIVNLWDDNARRGTPSVGLMQVIGPTYRSNAPRNDRGPFKYGTSVDPFENIYASIRYTVGRYGSGPAGWDRPGGYAMGGILPFLGSYQTGVDRVPHDGLAFLHRDEAVLDHSDAAMFRQAGMDSVKAKTFQQTNQFYGITDYGEIARTTGDELAWQVTVGSH